VVFSRRRWRSGRVRIRIEGTEAMLKHNLAVLPLRRDVYRAKLVFYLFLLSLAVFFAASILSYCAIRANAFRDADRFRYQPLAIPATFWVSTVFLLCVSGSLHRAVRHVRRNHIGLLMRSLMVASVFAVGFVAMQSQGLTELLYARNAQYGPETKSFAICFTLAFLHGLHVVGGIGFLGFIMVQGLRRRYDHERHWPVDNCASYWHFLDIVWCIMLATFLIAR
jgi:heme/copper-type cytochrome/quinol oxidase subunit 3